MESKISPKQVIEKRNAEVKKGAEESGRYGGSSFPNKAGLERAAVGNGEGEILSSTIKTFGV